MDQPLYIVWNEDYELGVNILDEQHRALVSTINSLYYFITRGSGVQAIKPTLRVLEEYTNLHFATEEAFMKSFDFHDFKEHRQFHQHLMAKTLTLSNHVYSEEDALKTLDFLKNWWLNHINGEDRLMVQNYFERSA